MLFDSIRSFFKSKKNDPESFYSMVESTQWKNFIGNDEIKMIKGVIKVSELEVSDIMFDRGTMISLTSSSETLITPLIILISSLPMKFFHWVDSTIE
jgi:Mg2+/Co2+ transporter CorC